MNYGNVRSAAVIATVALLGWQPSFVQAQLRSGVLDQTRSILESGTSPEETLPPPRPKIDSTRDAEIDSASGSDLSAGALRPQSDSSASFELELQTLRTRLGYDILLQGPVHEAFAFPAEQNIQERILEVQVAPPEPIREQPPEPKPQGHNVQWLAGYWAWIDEAKQYVWVSGLYRDPPPDRVWTQGHWSRTASGYVWTNGYWAETASLQNSVYLPAPPASLDNGPGRPQPETDSFWLPGHWVFVENEYRWQDGYWTAQPDNWIWQPAYWVNTPRGFIFVSGFWDYEPQFRGQCFAPVVFHAETIAQPFYSFRPNHPQASPAAMLLHLFVRQGCREYYYGDFYGASFVNLGFVPWYSVQRTAGANAPLLAYYHWKYGRHGIDFVANMARYQSHFRATATTRPAYQSAANLGLAADGIAGAINANSFDEIVRGRFAGQATQAIQLAQGANQNENQVASASYDRAGASYSAQAESNRARAPQTSGLPAPGLGGNTANSGSTSLRSRLQQLARPPSSLPATADSALRGPGGVILVGPGGPVALVPPRGFPIGPGGIFGPPPQFPIPPAFGGPFRGGLGPRLRGR